MNRWQGEKTFEEAQRWQETSHDLIWQIRRSVQRSNTLCDASRLVLAESYRLLQQRKPTDSETGFETNGETAS